MILLSLHMQNLRVGAITRRQFENGYTLVNEFPAVEQEIAFGHPDGQVENEGQKIMG